MSSPQRISRGFHRLALFLAAIPLLIGIGSMIFTGIDANNSWRRHQKLVCAHEHTGDPNKPWTYPWDAFVATQVSRDDPVLEDREINLKPLGCSNSEYDTVKFGEALNPPEFSWLSELAKPLSFGLGIGLAVSLAVYGVVRAIGWVIGGFAA